MVEHSFVGAQVHIAFGAVFEDEDFAVAVGVEGARVDIEVPLHFDRGDGETFVFEHFGHAGRENALAEARHDGPEDDDILMKAFSVSIGDGGVELGVGARFASRCEDILTLTRFVVGGPACLSKLAVRGRKCLRWVFWLIVHVQWYQNRSSAPTFLGVGCEQLGSFVPKWVRYGIDCVRLS